MLPTHALSPTLTRELRPLAPSPLPPTTVALTLPLLGVFVNSTFFSAGVSYVEHFDKAAVMEVVVNTVTETALLSFIDAREDLQVKEVADFHSDASHPVCPIREDGDFPSPKADPNKVTEKEPADAVRRGCRHEGSQEMGTKRLHNCSKEAGLWERDSGSGVGRQVLERELRHLRQDGSSDKNR
jgi:hypothetical protein